MLKTSGLIHGSWVEVLMFPNALLMVWRVIPSQRRRLLASAGPRELQGSSLCARLPDRHQKGGRRLQPSHQGKTETRAAAI